MKTKLLFLDIDGVVNCKTTVQRHEGFIGIDPKLAEFVKRIIKETGCEVVLSSTWRLSERGRNHVRERVCDFIDVTSRSASGFRGAEIQDWLLKNMQGKEYRYAILDDASDFYPSQPLYKTTWATGINASIAKRVIKHLNA